MAHKTVDKGLTASQLEVVQSYHRTSASFMQGCMCLHAQCAQECKGVETGSSQHHLLLLAERSCAHACIILMAELHAQYRQDTNTHVLHVRA